MEEKILIESKINKKVKFLLLGITLVFWVIAAMFLVYFLSPNKYPYGIIREYSNLDMVFAIGGVYKTRFILGCLSFAMAIIGMIVFLALSSCKLVVTEKNVKGKTFFGKEVVLPIHMISAYSTRKFLSVIAVATASGLTKFALIANYAEIGDVLSQLINQRQEQTQTQNVATNTKTSNLNMDDLIKLKSLLEQGVITQEEFEAKKKQLLDL